jgi:predicted nuclease of restriction endonuclease-like (RecB) superfamily
MNFEKLIEVIEQTNSGLQKRVLSTANKSLVIRNWLVGLYIVEFEQNGEDHAQYGRKLFKSLAKSLKNKKINGFSETNLRLFRQFYRIYPQFYNLFVKESTLNTGIDIVSLYFSIRQPLADELPQLIKGENYFNSIEYYQELIENLSFSHFTYLIQVEDPIKRAFYEHECIKGNWGKRTLERQIESLLAERLLMSKDKDKMLEMIHKKNVPPTIEETIKDPYILEFTGFKELAIYSENQLETRLLDKLQDFLLELGNGFCFEARQKRFAIGNEQFRIDLVFYHRILRCHIIIDLKTRAFSHADVGQMNLYLNYYKKNMMIDGDNPPIGIILCTKKDDLKVEYATAGIDNNLFVSKYMVELPTIEELQRVIEND